MNSLAKAKQLALLIGDVAVFYLALAITLFVRYGSLTEEIATLHFWPFTIVLLLWFFIAYIAGLYELRWLKNNQEFVKKLLTVVLIGGLLAVFLFYLIPAFVIAPKTNLFIFLAIFGMSLYVWRTVYNTFLTSGQPENKILLVGYNQTAEELAKHLSENPQLGYEIKFWMKEGLQDKEFEHLSQIILSNGINLIVVPAHIKKISKSARAIYKNIALGVEVMDLAELYSRIFLKVPLAELEEVWFLENLAKSHRIYEAVKKPLEMALAVPLILLLLPLGTVIGLIIALTSRGPVIFRQSRIGKSGKEFILYKFRTMFSDAEKSGPQWAAYNDNRATPIGKFLRKSHLDELPQLINLLKGDVSLVGPRPERPEFVNKLLKEIPFYELRHLARPGITGWSQINYRYGSSVEDAYEKLQFEIYYMKNRSLVLDLLILLKTIRHFFVTLR